MIGGKWKARILHRLYLGPCAFAPLKRALPGISQQVLSTQLQAMADDDLVARTPSRAGSVYALTETGLSLAPVLDIVAAWGEDRLRQRGLEWARPHALERSGPAAECDIGAS